MILFPVQVVFLSKGIFLDVFKCFKLSCSAPLFKNLKRFESTFILFKKRLKVNVEEMSKKQLNITKIVGYL